MIVQSKKFNLIRPGKRTKRALMQRMLWATIFLQSVMAWAWRVHPRKFKDTKSYEVAHLFFLISVWGQLFKSNNEICGPSNGKTHHSARFLIGHCIVQGGTFPQLPLPPLPPPSFPVCLHLQICDPFLSPFCKCLLFFFWCHRMFFHYHQDFHKIWSGILYKLKKNKNQSLSCNFHQSNLVYMVIWVWWTREL